MSNPAWQDAGTDSASDDTVVIDAVIVPDEQDDIASDWFGGPSPSASVPDDAREITGNVVGIGSRSPKSDKPESLDRDAKSGIPNIGEWENFFGNVLIRLATDFYIDVAFRDIDESLLSEREIERIKLNKTERDRIARPFAEFSNKSKFMRKHGRMIIASGDSIDAFIQIGMWASRVNRIARAVRNRAGVVPKVTRAPHISRPQGQRPARQQHAPQQQMPIPHAPQAGENDSVSFGESAEKPGTLRPAGWRPDVAGAVFNPGGG